MTQYQAEYRGVVQYYRIAYNLHTLRKLRRVTELSRFEDAGKQVQNFMPENLPTILHNHRHQRGHLQGTSGESQSGLQEAPGSSFWSSPFALE